MGPEWRRRRLPNKSSTGRSFITRPKQDAGCETPFADQVWRDGTLENSLQGDRIVVFQWAIDHPSAAATRCLTPAERERAERFRFEKDRVAFTLGRAGLRTIVGGLIGVEPSQAPLVEGQNGKPRLGSSTDEFLAFNLSHSGKLAVLAVTRASHVGVDLERIPDDKPPPLEVAKRCFVGDELAALDAATEDELPEVFYRLWTRKEAVVKLLGDGLQAPLTEFTVGSDTEAADWIDLPGGNSLGIDRCWLQSLPVPTGYCAALACVAPPTAVTCQTLTIE